MFCSKCGKEIDNDAVVCIHCGVATQNMSQTSAQPNQPIIINNSSSSSASAAAASSSGGKTRRHYSLLFDIFMICITCGLWLIWMFVRPKYY